MRDEPRALLVIGALVAAGAFVFASPRPAAPPPSPKTEAAPKPAAKPLVKPKPLPAIAKPKPIVAPEKRATQKRPKDAKPKTAKAKQSAGPRGMTREMCKRRSRSLPSCDVVRWCQSQMSWGDQMTAYLGATAEQVAHGRKCLGR